MTWLEIEDAVHARMTPPLAQRIRTLRIDMDFGWRSVSDDIFEYPEGVVFADLTDLRGGQPLGMFLCEAAAAVFGEDAHKEPWN